MTFVNDTVGTTFDQLTKTECDSSNVKSLSDRVRSLCYEYEHPLCLSANMELFNTSEPFLEHIQKLYSEQPFLEHIKKLFSEYGNSDYTGEPIRIFVLLVSPELNSAIRQLCRAIDSRPYPRLTLSGQNNLPFIHERNEHTHPVVGSGIPDQNKLSTAEPSALSHLLDSSSFKVCFVPTINGLQYEFCSSTFRIDCIIQFDASGSSRRVVDWNNAADSKIHASIRKAVDYFIQDCFVKTLQWSNGKEILDSVRAVYDPLGEFSYKLVLSDNPAGSGTRNKDNSLAILVILQPSDLTKEIIKLYKTVQRATTSGSVKCGKGALCSKPSDQNIASPVKMFVTAGAKLVKTAKSSIASRRGQPHEQADAIKSLIDVARSVGSTASSLRRNPVSSPSPAVSTPSRISGGLPSSSSSVPIVRDTAVDTSQVPTTPVPSVRTRSCSQNMCHLEMHFLAVLLS